MQKLKEELRNVFGIVFLIVFFIACKDSSSERKNRDSRKSVSNEKLFIKDSFFNCTGVRDTSFSNGDYLKYIPIDDQHYTVEVRINNVLDTLDFYLNCKTYSGMIPEAIVGLGSGYFGLVQGSSSYRYFTLCSFNKETQEIDKYKFETAIDVSSESDGLLFIKDGSLYFYDSEKRSCYSIKLSRDSNSFEVKELKLEKNRAVIICKDGDTQIYLLNEFRLAEL